jgi:hypothetical protein
MKAPALELFKEHGAEAIRECGILWLVFSLLDQAVSGKLTLPWFLGNVCGSIAVWFIGMYIELKRDDRDLS